MVGKHLLCQTEHKEAYTRYNPRGSETSGPCTQDC